MDRREKLNRLTDYAADQAGLVSSHQAARLGLAPSDLVHLARDGHLRRIRRGVYTFSTGRATSPSEDLLAAYLAVNPDVRPWDRTSGRVRAIVSHASAAALYGIGTIIPGLPELTQRDQRSRAQRDMVVRTAEFTDEDWQWRDVTGFWIAVATPARTIVDLILDGTELDYARRAIADTYADPGTATSELNAALQRRRTNAHVRAEATLRRLLAQIWAAP